MTVLAVDLSPFSAGHLAIALRLYRARCPTAPSDLADVEAAAASIARAVTDPHGPSGAVTVVAAPDDPQRDRDFLSLAQAARVTGLSRATIERRVRSGDLPSVLTGRRRLIPTSALAEFLAVRA